MGKVPPEPGTVVKNTTFTEVLTPQSKKEQENLTLWEYMERLKPEEYGRHMAYVYRWIDKGELATVGKLTVPFDEFGLKDAFGGGNYRVILKCGAQIVKRVEKVICEGNPKNPDDAPVHTVNTPGGHTTEMGLIVTLVKQQTDLLERVLTRQDRGPLIDEGIRGAMGLQADVFRGGVDAIRQTLTPQVAAPAPNPMDDVMKQFMTAAIAKMLNPADPIEAFSKMASAFSSLKLGDGGGGQTSVGVEIVRAIGGALPQIAQAVTTYTGAQLEAARLATTPRTINVQPGPQPVPIRANADAPAPGTMVPAALPPAAPNAETQKPAAVPPQGGEVQSPNLEWLELKIAEIIMDQQTSVSEAASEAVSFLQVSAPQVLEQLVTDQTGNTINYLFATRRILALVPKNPRLSEFIAKFLELGAQPAPAAAPSGGMPEPDPPPAS